MVKILKNIFIVITCFITIVFIYGFINYSKPFEKFKINNGGILLGSSRKSWINGIDKCDVSNRLGGSLASALYCYKKGVKMFRVHDVKETYQALKVYKNLCLM